jgi:hypothetical protein
MKLPISTLMILVGSSCLIVIMMTRAWLLKYRGDPFQFELVLMRPGVNIHKRITGSELEFETKDGGVKVSPLERILFKLRGIERRFIVTFQHGETDPIKPLDGIDITSRVLKQVNESRALDKALRGEFKMGTDLKKLIMIIGVILVVVIAYVLYSGGIVV